MSSNLIVVMGVSGAGKTTVGIALANRLGLDFMDADSLHSESNVSKMASGIPLTDDDRWPWLSTVGHALANAGDDGLVMACSALKHSYRDAIRAVAPTSVFVLLTVDTATLAQRVATRPGHFMPPALLDSQLALLEPLEAGEGVTVPATGGIEGTAELVAVALSES